MDALSKQHWKVVILSSLGGALEFYDFVVFAIFASYIGENFFVHQNHIVELIAAFALFAIGYFIRPIGGILFSHFGDRFGRKLSFAISISMMAVSTLLMGLVPSYQTIGITAPLLFILLRIVQGLAVGGEIPGAITFVSEHIKGRPGFACGMLFLFINLGIVLADGVHAVILHFLSPAEVSQYGWRFAFIFGGLLAIVSYILRTRLEETPIFIKERETTHNMPFFHLFRRHFKEVVAGTLITSLGASIVSLLYLYMVSYLQTINNYSSEQTTQLTFAGLISFSLAIFVIGTLSDYLGKKKLILLGAALFTMFSLEFFNLIVAHDPNVLYWVITWGVVSGLITGCFPCLLAKIFPMNVRYSGVAFCYNVGFAVFGGLSPLVASLLIHHTKNLASPSWVLVMTSGLCVLGLLLIYKTPEIIS